MPDETTILRFRHLLKRHDLTPNIFETINTMLADKSLILKAGTVVDATIIAAPSSTKNKDRKRDPEMHQTKKANQWHFGIKAHIGVDADSGLVHTVIGTAAHVSDVTQAGALRWFSQEHRVGDDAVCHEQLMDESQAFDGSAGICAPAMHQMALLMPRHMLNGPSRD